MAESDGVLSIVIYPDRNDCNNINTNYGNFSCLSLTHSLAVHHAIAPIAVSLLTHSQYYYYYYFFCVTFTALQLHTDINIS